MNINTNSDQRTKPTGNPKSEGKRLFTGEALTSLAAINPSKDEIVKLKNLENIEDQVREPQYTGIVFPSGNTEFTKIEFMLEFDPDRILTGEESENKYYVSYPIFISKELGTNKAGDKIQVIDDHLNSAWIPYTEGKTATEALKAAKELGSNVYIDAMDDNTTRYAKSGEVNLYNFLFNMTWLPRHRPDKGDVLEGFVLGGDPAKASETFDKLVDGDFKILNEITETQFTRYKDGSSAKIGVLLGVKIDNNDPTNVKFYQEVYNNPMHVCSFKETSYVSDRGNHKTRLSKDAYKNLVHDQYGWGHFWNNSMEFQEFDRSAYQNPGTELSDTPKQPEDDLPF
jgi:hypothetical protein